MSTKSGAGKKVMIFAIIGGVVMMASSILAGVLASRAAAGTQENVDCACIKPSDAGWRAFSITGFVLAFVGMVIAIVYLAKSSTMRATLGLPAKGAFVAKFARGAAMK